MIENILYSFVLPAYKARFLKKAISSILTQSYSNFELIIVNDHSPEDLDSIVLEFNDSRIRYYTNEKNIGGEDLVAQWNHCISYASGNYLILASDDDEYHHQYLEKMNVLVEKYPNVNVFRPRVQYTDENGFIIRIGGVLSEYSTSMEFIYYLEHIGKGIPFYIFNKQALNKIGGFIKYPLAWHSDDMTVIQMANHGIVFNHEILFSMRVSGESISSKKNNTRTLKSKVIATNNYFSDLKIYIKQYISISQIDAHFQKKTNENITLYHASSLRNWFISSSKSAVIKCISLYWKSNVLGKRNVIKMYINKLLHKDSSIS